MCIVPYIYMYRSEITSQNLTANENKQIFLYASTIYLLIPIRNLSSQTASEHYDIIENLDKDIVKYLIYYFRYLLLGIFN